MLESNSNNPNDGNSNVQSNGGGSFPTHKTDRSVYTQLSISHFADIQRAILAAAEAASPGVGTRMSAADFVAVSGGTLSTIGLQNLKTKLHISPPPSLLSEVSSALKAVSDTIVTCSRAPPAQEPSKPKKVKASAGPAKTEKEAPPKKKQEKPASMVKPPATASGDKEPSKPKEKQEEEVDPLIKERRKLLKKVLRSIGAKTGGADAAEIIGLNSTVATELVNMLSLEEIKEIRDQAAETGKPLIEVSGLFDKLLDINQPGGWSASALHEEWLDQLKAGAEERNKRRAEKAALKKAEVTRDSLFKESAKPVTVQEDTQYHWTVTDKVSGVESKVRRYVKFTEHSTLGEWFKAHIVAHSAQFTDEFRELVGAGVRPHFSVNKTDDEGTKVMKLAFDGPESRVSVWLAVRKLLVGKVGRFTIQYVNAKPPSLTLRVPKPPIPKQGEASTSKKST